MNGSQPTYEFGPFRLDGDKRLLLRDAEPVALAPKAFETLLALIERRHQLMTKDELLQRIWGDTVIEESGLTRNVSILRKTLGEKPDDHQYIVTVPGQGYRFVADVRETAGDAGVPEDDVLAVAGPAKEPRGRRSLSLWLVLGGLAALLAGSALVYVLRPLRAVNAGRPSITALAVLPLDNLSGDPSQEYFADGMTEALIGNLARVRALRVVSRTSVMRFKGASRPLPEIARTLNVDAVLEGSVQRTGDRVRISLQLIDPRANRHSPVDTDIRARAG
jgi:TolB-like protein/DNA-binding winged helix-turn-helix (wHTH) protein